MDGDFMVTVHIFFDKLYYNDILIDYERPLYFL